MAGVVSLGAADGLRRRLSASVPVVEVGRVGRLDSSAEGRDLIDEEHQGGASIEVLHRMIAYVRAEALRLDVMDVALLLDHAGDALTAFAPRVPGCGPAARETHHVEH